MTAGPSPAPAKPSLVYIATGIMLLQQALSTMAGLSMPVLVPPIAADTGLDPSLIGLFVPLVYAGSMVSSIGSGGLLLRFGAFRVGQLCLLGTSIGMLLCSTGYLPAFVVGGVILGMGNGPSTPAGSHVLARYTTPKNAPMMFSLKQTGVPVGGMMAGMLLPVLVIYFGWQGALIGAAGMSLAFVVFAQPLRREFDSDRQPGRSLRMMDVRATLMTVLHDARIRELAISIFVFTGLQITFASFFVSFLAFRLGWTLTEAGVAYSAAMVSGIVFRIVWGWIAARFVAPVYVLAALGTGMGCALAAVALVGPGWGRYAVWGVAMLFGATGIGFQGVLLAEIARIAPHGMAGVITGGTVFFAFVGMILFPALFGVMLSLGGGYTTMFAIAAIPPILVAAMLCINARRRAARTD